MRVDFERFFLAASALVDGRDLSEREVGQGFVDLLRSLVGFDYSVIFAYRGAERPIDLFSTWHFTASITLNFMSDANVHQKPVMIGESCPRELGVTGGQQSWDDWFAPYFALIRNNAGIKAFCYINWSWDWQSGWQDGRIERNATVTRNYRDEMALPLYLHATTKKDFLEWIRRKESKRLSNIVSWTNQVSIRSQRIQTLTSQSPALVGLHANECRVNR